MTTDQPWPWTNWQLLNDHRRIIQEWLLFNSEHHSTIINLKHCCDYLQVLVTVILGCLTKKIVVLLLWLPAGHGWGPVTTVTCMWWLRACYYGYLQVMVEVLLLRLPACGGWGHVTMVTCRSWLRSCYYGYLHVVVEGLLLWLPAGHGWGPVTTVTCMSWLRACYYGYLQVLVVVLTQQLQEA